MGCPLRENVCLGRRGLFKFAMQWLNLLYLADMLQKFMCRTYGSSYEELFRFIDLNIDKPMRLHSVLVAPSATSRASDSRTCRRRTPCTPSASKSVMVVGKNENRFHCVQLNQWKCVIFKKIFFFCHFRIIIVFRFQ